MEKTSGTTCQTASSTAERMTMHRAFEANYPESEQVIQDPYAVHFVDRRTQNALKSIFGRFMIRMVMNRVYPGVNGAVVSRVRFMDEAVLEAVDQGISQVVIPGAGYDTRAFRLDRVKEKARVFELDHPATHARKKEKVRDLFDTLPGHVHYLGADLAARGMNTLLACPAYDPGKSAVFLLEGLVMYLSPDQVDHLLAFIREHAGPGSQVAFDYLPAAMANGNAASAEARNMLKFVAKTGEPFRFGLDNDKAEGFLRDRGFEVIRHLPATGCRARYFKGKGKKRKISGLFHFIHARVA